MNDHHIIKDLYLPQKLIDREDQKREDLIFKRFRLVSLVLFINTLIFVPVNLFYTRTSIYPILACSLICLSGFLINEIIKTSKFITVLCIIYISIFLYIINETSFVNIENIVYIPLCILPFILLLPLDFTASVIICISTFLAQIGFTLYFDKGLMYGINSVLSLIILFPAILCSIRFKLNLQTEHLAYQNELEKKTNRLLELNHNLKEMGISLLHTEQDERERIAHIFHGEMQQNLIACRLLLSQMNSIDEQDERKLELIKTAIENSINQNQRLIIDLSPMICFNSIEDCVAWLIKDFQDKYSLQVDLVISPTLHSEVRGIYMVFEILKELMFNAVKHSLDNQIMLEINKIDEQIHIQSKNRVQGQRKREETYRRSFGIKKMNTFLKPLDGNLQTKTDQEGYFFLKLSFNLKKTQSKNIKNI